MKHKQLQKDFLPYTYNQSKETTGVTVGDGGGVGVNVERAGPEQIVAFYMPPRDRKTAVH